MTREELKEEMKATSAAVWNRSRVLLQKYGMYGIFGLAFSAGIAEKTSAPEVDSSYVQSLADGSRRLDNRLKIEEMKRGAEIAVPMRAADKAAKKETISWDEAISPSMALKLPQYEADWQAEESLKQAMGTQVAGNVSIEALMQKSGVTAADIQAVVSQKPEILQGFAPGKTGQLLAKAADQITGKPKGACLGGVQTMIGVAQIGVTIEKDNPDWPPREKYAGKDNSACNAYIPLEKSGKFFTLNIKNKACTFGNPANKKDEDLEMKEFNRMLPSGTIASIDNKRPNAVSGFKPRNNGEIHGHTWILDNNKKSKCDGEQPNGPDFTRYGPEMHISIAKDCRVSQEIALEFIKQAQERQSAQSLHQQYKIAGRG